MLVQPVKLELDSNVRRVSNGTALMGGSPFRLVRLSRTGAELLDAWLEGKEVDRSPQSDALRARLVDAGMVHPVFVAPPEGVSAINRAAVVVPVFADPDGLAILLTALREQSPDIVIVVVDDASPQITAIEETVRAHDGELVRHDSNCGPAAARNTGWRHLATTSSSGAPEFVIFLDADVIPSPTVLATLLAHFDDPGLAAVGPRVRATAGSSAIDAYERVSSPLDLGGDPALVYPRTRVSYVPSAALAIRMTALAEHDGFDESLRFGEDVDLIWRLTKAENSVRYASRAVVEHRNRSTVTAFARQRFVYGSSAAPLERRHPGDVAPAEVMVSTLAIWSAALFGGLPGRTLAMAGVAASTIPIERKLKGKVENSATEAARLVLRGQMHSAHWLTNAASRSWLPLLGLSRVGRRLGLACVVLPALARWLKERPSVDPASFTALSAVDDVSYCAGVWSGVLRTRSLGAVLPRIRWDLHR